MYRFILLLFLDNRRGFSSYRHHSRRGSGTFFKLFERSGRRAADIVHNFGSIRRSHERIRILLHRETKRQLFNSGTYLYNTLFSSSPAVFAYTLLWWIVEKIMITYLFFTVYIASVVHTGNRSIFGRCIVSVEGKF